MRASEREKTSIEKMDDDGHSKKKGEVRKYRNQIPIGVIHSWFHGPKVSFFLFWYGRPFFIAAYSTGCTL